MALLGAEAASAARPMDPWILRVALPSKVRMNLMTLGPGLTVVYDTPNAALYEAWTGTYVDGTATYEYQRGIRSCDYVPQGKILYKQAPGGAIGENPPSFNMGSTPSNEATVTVWSATQGTATVAAKPDYLGYALSNAGQNVTMRYRILVGAGSTAVDVQEAPDMAQGGGLQRDFTFKNIPSGTAVSLLLTGNTVNKSAGGTLTEEWAATGTGRVETRDGKRYLVQDKDGQTRLIGTWK
jgi:hypothetical protein